MEWINRLDLMSETLVTYSQGDTSWQQYSGFPKQLTFFLALNVLLKELLPVLTSMLSKVVPFIRHYSRCESVGEHRCIDA